MKAQATQPNKTQTAAIVTTLKNANAILDSYLTYHLSIGFSHIFLFFDDPNDSGIDIARKYPNVTIIKHDAELRRLWQKTRSWGLEDVRRYVETELISRQVLNTEVAIGLAEEKGIDWLLHIDTDELFYSPEQTVSEHFQSLAEQDVHLIVYSNHEAVTETTDIVNPFKEATLFKKNPRTLDAGRISDEQKAIIKDLPQLPDQFFFFYHNGKSAAKVSKRLMPKGSHGFHIIEGNVLSQLLRQYAGNRRVRSLASKIPWFAQRLDSLCKQSKIKKRVSGVACILHYPCCGFDAFWNRYVMRGAFSDKWFGKMDIRERLGSFTLDARDVVLSGNKEAAREFYENRFVMRNETDVELLIRSGLGCRIMGPSMMFGEANLRDSVMAQDAQWEKSETSNTLGAASAVPLIADAAAMRSADRKPVWSRSDTNRKAETGREMGRASSATDASSPNGDGSQPRQPTQVNTFH